MKRLFAVLFCAAVFLSGCAGRQTSNDKIGIIGALEEEVELLKDAADVKKTTEIMGMEFWEGTLDGLDVVIVECGMGKINAALSAAVLIDHFNVTHLINTGCAGSLDNDIDIGDFVVATDSIQHDYDAKPLGFAHGEVPNTGTIAYKTDETLQKKALKAIAEAAPEVKAFTGRVATGDQFIYLDEQREKILSDVGGLCCEMEGGAIGQVCALSKTPYIILRSISDKVDGSEEIEYEVFKKEAAHRSASVTMYMLAHWNDPVE